LAALKGLVQFLVRCCTASTKELAVNEWSPTFLVLRKFYRNDKKNDNTRKQAHNHYSAMFLLDETTFIQFLSHSVLSIGG
jgi:hypothetical protein